MVFCKILPSSGGVHDGFHASLLQIHVPNDDRLFPGQLDTQLGNADGTNGEWAIDKILGHAGSKTDAVFEICWKSRDTTWLPYYQINHLAALQQYFDILGIENISQLPEGKGKPPSDDLQTFVGNFGMRLWAGHKMSGPRKAKQESQNQPSLHPTLDKRLAQLVADIQSSSNASHYYPDARRRIPSISHARHPIPSQPLHPHQHALCRMRVPPENLHQPFPTRQHALPRNHIPYHGDTD